MKKIVFNSLFVVVAISSSYFAYSTFSDNNSNSISERIENETTFTKQPQKSTPNIKNIRRNKIGETLPKRKSPHTISPVTKTKPTSTANAVENKIVGKTNQTDKEVQIYSQKVSNVEVVKDEKGKEPSIKLVNPIEIVATPLAPSLKSKEVEIKPAVNSKVDPLVETAYASNIFDSYGHAIYVDVRDARKGKKIKGEVTVYDNKRLKKIKDIKTHTIVGIKDPENGDQSIRIASSIFGYKPVEISFSLLSPATGNTIVESLNDSVSKVNLEIERLQVGDLAVMWKVYFFRDAAIMRPDSKNQLNDLVNMMTENPNMRIKLHGHTNGNSHGKIIHLGENDNNDLFNINSQKHIETAGSAQKLSLFRAETIQHYLITQDIDLSRIEIKGWGGKKMLHDKHDSQAKLNVRVEVEIIDN